MKTVSVSPEFINENQAAYVSRKRMGGPSNKKEKFLRRQEVYKLYFDRGHSALKVSKMIRVHRHTVEADIRYWYSKLAKDWQESDIDGWAQKQINRLESGRTCLLEELDNQQDLNAKLAIRKIVIALDEKIA